MLSLFRKKAKVCVHSGKFHPDDVTAVAIVSLYLGRAVEIVRSRNPEDWAKADYVFDVGGEYDPARNRFDHHQESFTDKRENSIPYSSAGLAWKHFGDKVAGSREVWAKIDKKLIQPLDAEDNGMEIYHPAFAGIDPYEFSDFLHSFNPTWKEAKRESSHKAFAHAVAEAKKMLVREVKRAKDNLAGEALVRRIYAHTADKRIIVLDDAYSSRHFIESCPEPLFVIEPHAETDRWYVNTVLAGEGKFKRRKYFPQSWADKRDGELAVVTGVPDAVYCHKDLFVAVARSKEGAIKLAELALLDHTK
ncbi:MAG: MYG1 family protein [Patescibacteria group bacterium]|nr:MYG1 family protein [Patescibacteria group bacterium]MDE1946115.1 MYG1 family protein [Patescibacteria group bacterium]